MRTNILYQLTAFFLKSFGDISNQLLLIHHRLRNVKIDDRGLAFLLKVCTRLHRPEKDTIELIDHHVELLDRVGRIVLSPAHLAEPVAVLIWVKLHILREEHSIARIASFGHFFEDEIGGFVDFKLYFYDVGVEGAAAEPSLALQFHSLLFCHCFGFFLLFGECEADV
jgi:hypothetical protein